jgi:hypothetical protein
LKGERVYYCAAWACERAADSKNNISTNLIDINDDTRVSGGPNHQTSSKHGEAHLKRQTSEKFTID